MRARVGAPTSRRLEGMDENLDERGARVRSRVGDGFLHLKPRKKIRGLDEALVGVALSWLVLVFS